MGTYHYIILALGMLAMLGFSTISDSQKGKQGEELKKAKKIDKMLKEAFPISSILLASILIITLFSFLIHIYDSTFVNTYVNSLVSTKSIIIHILGTGITTAIIFFFVTKEYKNVTNELHSLRPNLYPSIIATVILGALTMNIALIPIANRVLDISNPKEEIVKIVQKEAVSRYRKTSLLFLYFYEQLYDVTKMEVTSDEYSSVKEGEEVKLKIYNGLFGIKYKSGNLQVIKKEGNTTSK